LRKWAEEAQADSKEKAARAFRKKSKKSSVSGDRDGAAGREPTKKKIKHSPAGWGRACASKGGR